MSISLCTVADEAFRLDVGQGAAVVQIVAALDEGSFRKGPCALDAGSMLRAREEGRAAPELVAFRVLVDGRELRVGGPRAEPTVEVPRAETVRIVAVLRGDRFAAVPLAISPAARRAPVPFRAVTSSVWGPARIAGVARFVEVGAPVVVTVDPARDHEPPRLVETIPVDAHGVPTIVADAGPVLASDARDEAARREALARGGADALAVLLADVPLSVATAPDRATALANLREAARVARAASSAADPLVAAVGQRLATAIATGFATCRRTEADLVPAHWPAPPPGAVATGLLDDGETGCPRVADLLGENHPDVRWPREGAAALAEAMQVPASMLPRVASFTRAMPAQSPPKWGRILVGRRRLGLVVVVVSVAFALAFGLLSGRRRPRYPGGP